MTLSFRTLLVAWALLTVPLLSFAQTDTALSRSYEEFDPPYFTYGKGLGITAPDSLFQLNFRFRMQNRIGVEMKEGKFSAVRARIRRFRLKFNGFIYTSRIRYAVEIGFTTEDTRSPVTEIPLGILRDVMIYYSFDDHWTLAFGQTKLPGNRERLVSSGDLQLADRSAANSIFNIDRDFGLQGAYRNAIGGSAPYMLRGAITSGEGTNWISSPGVHLSYTFRGEVLPFGPFAKRGDYFQGDLKREPLPRLSVGLVFNYNDNALREAGQRGDLLHQPRTIRNFMADALFKYKGWAFMTEFMVRNAPDPLTVNPQDTSDVIYVFNGRGFTLQGSYLFPSDLEVTARYASVYPNEEIREFSPTRQNYYTAGITQYIRGHRLKVQLDATYVDRIAFGEISAVDTWNFRFQVELGI
jgi:hypothetical protein